MFRGLVGRIASSARVGGTPSSYGPVAAAAVGSGGGKGVGAVGGGRHNVVGRALQAAHVQVRATTILCVRKDGQVFLGGDGQVSQGSSVVKPNARKVRKIGDSILVGFAGSTADAITLLERLEKKLQEHSNQLMRACVELAKDWRTDKYLRKLEATLLVADANHTFEITGNGDVLEPPTNAMAIGSGGAYAQSAAIALLDVPGLDAEHILRKSMKIAGDFCVYTNHNLIVESLPGATNTAASFAATSTSASASETKEEIKWK